MRNAAPSEAAQVVEVPPIITVSMHSDTLADQEPHPDAIKSHESVNQATGLGAPIKRFCRHLVKNSSHITPASDQPGLTRFLVIRLLFLLFNLYVAYVFKCFIPM